MTEPTTTAPPLRIAPPPPGWRPGNVTAGGPSGLATASLVLGIVALVLNVLLVPTLLAIVFGAVSLARGSHRTRAVVGIVLGALGVLTSATIAIPVFLAVQQSARAEAVAASISNDAANSGVSLADVRCPAPPTTAPGATLVCSAEDGSGTPVRIDVTFTSTSGAFTYRVVDG